MKEDLNTCEYWNMRYGGNNINTACPNVWKHILSFFKWRRSETGNLIPDCDEKILDIGCGIGLGLRLINILYPYKILHAIDISDLAIKRVEEYCPAVNAMVGKVPPLPYDDDFFDTVICTELLEHVQDYVKLIVEIKRVLKPDGRLLLAIPHNCLGDTPEHNHMWTGPEMVEILADNGLYATDARSFMIDKNTNYYFIAADFEGLK